MKTWEELPFWTSEDWFNAQDKLDALESEGKQVNPDRSNLFACLDCCEFRSVSVCICAQDPYPDPRLATGVALSIPRGMKHPPTLQTVLKEYSDDLWLPIPEDGDLLLWCSRGVLLLNAIPCCVSWQSMSCDWPEWKVWRTQIVEGLSARPVVFVLLGRKARELSETIQKTGYRSPLIELSHPSPRASHFGNDRSFCGSRMFSRVNDALRSLGRPAIDWRLE